MLQPIASLQIRKRGGVIIIHSGTLPGFSLGGKQPSKRVSETPAGCSGAALPRGDEILIIQN